MKKYSYEDYQNMAKLLKVSGEITRLKIIHSLIENNKGVVALAESLEISQSLLSHQLKKMKDENLIKFKKEGRYKIYSIKDKHILELFNAAYEHVKNCCENKEE